MNNNIIKWISLIVSLVVIIFVGGGFIYSLSNDVNRNKEDIKESKETNIKIYDKLEEIAIDVAYIKGKSDGKNKNKH